MSNFERVFCNMEELHPMVNGKFFTIPISIEMKGFAKEYFNIDIFDEFVHKIKDDNAFKNKVIDIINKKWNMEQRKIITSKSGEIWFFVDYKKIDKPYTLMYTEKLANLNESSFFENYTDIFGNKIEFEVYS